MNRSWTVASARGRALLLALAFLVVSPSAAAPAATEPSSAREAYQRAVAAYNVGQFEEALAAYTEAYRLDPLPATLFNIAQCHRQLGSFSQAAFHYRRYLAQFAAPPPNAALVEELLTEMTTREELARRAHELEQAERAQAAADAPRAEGPNSLRDPGSLAPVGAALSGPAPEEAAASVPPGDTGSVFKRWWFWSGLAVVAAAGTGVYFLSTREPSATTLGTLSFR